MHNIDLPDAYRRLIEAQRHISPEERQALDEEAARESRANRMRRKLPRVY